MALGIREVKLGSCQLSSSQREQSDSSHLSALTQNSFISFSPGFSPVLSVGYRITENPDRKQSLDIVGGVRYWHLETNLNFGAGILPAASATRSKGWVDAVGGVRARAFLTKKFFLAGKVDAGGGGAKFTYQLFGVGGYQITDRIALVAGWRHLKVNYDKDNFLFDMALDGRVFGATFIIK